VITRSASRTAPRSRRRLLAALGAAAGLLLGATAASSSPPWVEPGALPLPSDAQSARILLADQPLLSAPFGAAPRRGTALLNARLPIFAARHGAGCRGSWLEVGPSAWVCDENVELASQSPIAAQQRTWPESVDGLPFRYFFVGSAGSLAYKRLDLADIGEPDMQLDPGFAVAVVAERLIDGAHYGRTQHGLWVPMRDLGAVRPLSFEGVSVPAAAEGAIPVAWVVADKARVLSKPAPGALTSAVRARFDVVPVLDELKSFSGKFVKIAEGSWVSTKDLRRPTVADPPPEVDVAAGEKWIDVDLESQTLVAYEGKRPVFATLVSTGKGRQGSPLATPKGTHRIWIKLLSSDMDNLEDEGATRYYRIENVPWVQYFAKGVGLHGAFWHRSFGQVRSHGCVNLTPLDAQRLFWWTGPHLPAGWTAVFPSAHEPGTVIRVR
jgi:lipoprotein-anchoring transpeptidase ErfK/SrfK